MGLKISGLNELRERLERLRPEEVMARALAAQAERMADAVRHNLSDPPGSGEHDQPWRQTGALHDSVGATADGLQATVGSSDPAAVPQEMGTAHMPPRPFLAPVAAGMGEEAARAVGARVAAALRGESGPDDAGDAMPHAIQASATMPDVGVMLFGLSAAALGYLILKDRVPKAPSPSHPPGPTILEHSSDEGEDTEGAKKPPPGSKPIDRTPWSGNHQEIKKGNQCRTRRRHPNLAGRRRLEPASRRHLDQLWSGKQLHRLGPPKGAARQRQKINDVRRASR